MRHELETINIAASKAQVKEIQETVDFRNKENEIDYLDLQKHDGETYALTIESRNIINAELENILRLARIPLTQEEIQARAIYKFTPNGNMTATIYITSSDK